MTEFWKSGERIWCEQCEVYVRFNLVKQHQQTPKHKSRVERMMSSQRAGRTKEGMEEERVKRELAKMERLASGSVMNDVAAGRAGSHETAMTFAAAVKPRPPGPPRQQQQPRAQKRTVEEEVADMWKEEEKQAKEEQEFDSEEEERRREEEEKADRAKAEAESQRRDALARDNYDPSNPYGQWVAASPPRREPEEEGEGGGEENVGEERSGKTRKQMQEVEDERFEEDVEEDANEGFEVKRVVASDRAFNEAVEMLDEEQLGGGEQVVFREKKTKERNTRKKPKTRDINE